MSEEHGGRGRRGGGSGGSAGSEQRGRELAAAFSPGLRAVALTHARQRVSGVVGVLVDEGEGAGGAAAAQPVVVGAHRCGLATLPAALGELTQLRRLDVGGNRLVEVPAFVTSLPRLRELYLDDNQVARLDALPALAVLDANRNQITEVPPLCGLEFVYLAENRLRWMPALDGVRYLNVSDNALEALVPVEAGRGGGVAGGLAALAELRAERCGLRELPAELGRLSGLRELSLRGNALERLPALLGGLRALEVLDLRGNQLDELPESLRDAPALRKLDLRWNPLRRRPAWLAELTARGCAVYA